MYSWYFEVNTIQITKWNLCSALSLATYCISAPTLPSISLLLQWANPLKHFLFAGNMILSLLVEVRGPHASLYSFFVLPAAPPDPAVPPQALSASQQWSPSKRHRSPLSSTHPVNKVTPDAPTASDLLCGMLPTSPATKVQSWLRKPRERHHPMQL